MEVMPEEPMDEKDKKIKDLEAKVMYMESLINEFKAKDIKMAEVTVDEDDEDEEVDVPVLDGAPIEEDAVNLSYNFKPNANQSTMDRVLESLSK